MKDTETSLKARLRRTLGLAEEWLMPSRLNCVICRDPRRADPETGICPACMAGLMEERVPASACPRCLSRMSARKGCTFCASGGLKGFSGAYAPFWYHPYSRQLVLAVKFGGNSEPVRFLGGWMSETLTDREFDMIVPVPLHRRRERYRGVNQAALLAREVAARTGIPLREDVLVREFRIEDGEEALPLLTSNDVDIQGFLPDLVQPMLEGMLKFLIGIPTSACQAIMDDLTELGVFQVILGG